MRSAVHGPHPSTVARFPQTATDLAQIWETVHQTLQADVTLPAASGAVGDGSAHTLVTALAGPTGPLAVVAGRAGIFVLTLVLQPASLLSALGRKSASAPFLLAESALLDAPALLVAPSQAALVRPWFPFPRMHHARASAAHCPPPTSRSRPASKKDRDHVAGRVGQPVARGRHA